MDGLLRGAGGLLSGACGKELAVVEVRAHAMGEVAVDTQVVAGALNA